MDNAQVTAAAPLQGCGPRCHAQGITGYGNLNADVMFLGIAPGFQEQRNGRPFVGPSGQLLDASLRSVNYPRPLVYCTNLVCFFPQDERGRPIDPDPSDIAACRARLVAEINQVKPKIIFTVGSIPTQQLVPGKKVGSISGQVIWSTEFDCWIIPTYHPAAVLRGLAGLYPDILRALDKIHTVLAWPKGYDEPEWYVAESPVDAQRIMNMIPIHAVCALDIETGSPNIGEFEDPFARQLLCLSLCWDSHTGYVIPIESIRGLYWSDDVQWLYHNGPSDTAGLKATMNIDLPIDHDTMLISYMFDERPGLHALKSLGREFCRIGFWEDELHAERDLWQETAMRILKDDYKKATGHMQPKMTDNEFIRQTFLAERRRIKNVGFEVVDPQTLYKYNATDAVVTRRLFDHFQARLTRV